MGQRISRRTFIRLGVCAGGGLLLRVQAVGAAQLVGTLEEGHTELNAFVRIEPSGAVTIAAPCPEIGQGTRTALPMIVADELRADWSTVKVFQAPAEARYGFMAVGGSNSVSEYWEPLRRAGASAREMLVAAAAARWSVPASECRAERSTVVHAASGRRLAYGTLAADAARQPVPESPALLDPSAFELIGRPTPRVDLDGMVTGRVTYGMDVRVEGMGFAVVARSPVRGGRVRRFDPAAALAVPGVLKVIEVPETTPEHDLYAAVRSGVAVIARDTHAAIRGRGQLKIEWDDGPGGDDGTDALRARMEARLRQAPDEVLRAEGDVDAALAAAARVIEADYELPPIAHGAMEPLCFTADVRDGRCDAIGPSQMPRDVQQAVAGALGIPPENVQVHTTLEGGGFGRRLTTDFGVEAALVSRAAGMPVQVVWTREDDIRFDFFRTPSRHRLRAGLDAEGRLVAWDHHVTLSPLVDHIVGPGIPHAEVYDVEGAVTMPWSVPNLRFAYSRTPVAIQLGSWRSVAHSFNVFVVNAFLDEIAGAVGRDPLALQVELLGEPREVSITLPYRGRRGRPTWHTGRLRAVLEAAAERAGWGGALPAGRGRGLAISQFKDTCCATVAEVEMSGDRPRVRRIVTAVDCGRVVNPDGVAAQVEGAAMDGVATVLHWGIRYENGRVVQSNFDNYPLLTIREAPEVDTVIVPSEAKPSGMGEPPYPAVMPAIVNAIHRASGRRVRRLPLRDA